MAEFDRRTFLRGATAVAGGALLGGPFAGYLAGPAAARSRRAGPPLGPVFDERDQVVRLWRDSRGWRTPSTRSIAPRPPKRRNGDVAGSPSTSCSTSS